jgi:hypothetical protein
VCLVLVFPFHQGDLLVSLVFFLHVVSCFGPSIGVLFMILVGGKPRPSSSLGC